MLHETSRLLAEEFDVEPSAVIAVSLQFDLDVNYISVNCIFDQLSVLKVSSQPSLDDRHSVCIHLQDFGQIDTSRTDIINYCPENLKHRWVHKTFTEMIIHHNHHHPDSYSDSNPDHHPRRCRARRYREQDGRCNNLEQPLWGAARVAHHRLRSNAMV